MQTDILSTLNSGGTGINISELAETLTKAEIDPRRSLVEARIDKAELRLSGYDRLRGQVEQVTEALGLMRGLSPLTVSSDNPAVDLSVRDAAALDPGQSSISVDRLAQAQVLGFDGFTGPDQPVGAGTLTVDFGAWGEGEPPVFDPAAREPRTLTLGPGATLSDLAASLNGVDGVTAQVIDRGDGRFTLGLISETGRNSALRLGVTDGAGPALAGLDITAGPGAAAVQPAQDASLSLNGIEVTRPGNQIDDLLPGVSLVLNATTTAPANVSARPNTEGALEVMQGFVDIVNATKTLVGTLTNRGMGDSAAAGDLAGDSLAGDLLRGMEAELAGSFGPQGVHLAQLGIATGRDGRWTLDETRLTEALQEDPAALGTLVRDTLSAPGAMVSGRPAEGTQAGRFTFTRDPETGAADLGGVALSGQETEDGQWLYTVTSGPMRGVSLRVPAETERTDLTFAPSMVGRVETYLDGVTSAANALSQRESALSASISEEQAELEALDQRAEEVRTRYMTRFTEMERVVTQLNSTGDYLENLVNAWNSDQ